MENLMFVQCSGTDDGEDDDIDDGNRSSEMIIWEYNKYNYEVNDENEKFEYDYFHGDEIGSYENDSQWYWYCLSLSWCWSIILFNICLYLCIYL